MTPLNTVESPQAARLKRRPKDPAKRHKADPRSVLVTLQQAAKEYGPAMGTLRDMVYSGHLERIQLADSRRIYIRRSQLEQLIGVGAK